MHKLLYALTAALLASASVTSAADDTLPRKAALGIAMNPPVAERQDAVVGNVLPGLTADRIGLRTGDIIVAAGGKPVRTSADVVAYAGALKSGDRVEIEIRRSGKTLKLRGNASGRPLETYANADVRYGAVSFRDGKLREILVTPRGVDKPPVLFLIQGFTCATMESPDPAGAYRRLGEELIARGIAYYRVEKPAVGDSVGSVKCSEIGYEPELDAFRTAYRHLIERHGFEADRVFMLGHSLGGLQAPMLAAELPPRGVAAYGTVLRNWADYHHDIDVYQNYLFTGADPASEAERAEGNREILRQFYFERLSPAQIVQRNPDAAGRMRDLFNWDGGDRMFGRHYRFAQDLAHQPLIKAWRNAKTNVLALYGESDIVALFDSDHEMIADIADFHRPGTGKYVQIAGTDHGMGRIGDRKELRKKTMAAGSPPDGPFNPRVAEVLADWIEESMSRPPVRTTPDRAPAQQGS
jgi:pimeloyl-ACP methyl ester carboxylesterase